MKDKKQLKEELKELSPWLLSMKEQGDGLKVPANYFEKLKEDVLARVKQPEPEPVPQPATPGWLDTLLENIRARFQPRYRLAYAFAALVVLVAAILVLRTQNDHTNSLEAMALENVSSEELLEYIGNHLDDFAPEDLLTARPEGAEDLSLPQLVPAPDESEIEDYLDGIMHDIDVEDIESIL